MLPMTYYDLVLVLIPAVGVALLTAALLVGIPIDTAILVASLPVLAVMAHAMFVHAPTEYNTE